MCFLNTDPFLLRIDNEDSARKLLHLNDTAKVLLKLLLFLLDVDNFLLGKNIKSAVLRHSADRLQALDTGLDGLEVGQHAAKPSLVDIELTATKRFGSDRILCLLLGADKKDRAAVSDDLVDRLVCLVNFTYGLLEIDDVDTVALGIDVGSHLRIPSPGLMAEVNTSFEKLLHRNNAH